MNSGVGDSNGSKDEDSTPSLRDLADKVKSRRSGRRRPERKADDDATDTPITEKWDIDTTDPERPVDGFGSDPKTEAIIEVLGEPANLLLLGPLLSPTDYDLCTMLTEMLPGDPDNLLVVTLTESPDERLNVLRGYFDHLPDNTAVLNIGDSTRAGSRETISTDHGGAITIENISDPTDLMRIGIAMSKQLSEWADAGGETVVCFHSLTALLQFAPDEKTVFRFVNVLRGRVQSVGATAHYHMDSGAHDEQTIATFRPLFDEVLAFEEDGSVHVAHS